MDAKKPAALAAALLAAASIVSCGSSSKDSEDSSIAFSPVTGDDYTANPGAWQTDGVPVPDKGVAMVGDPVAAQAVANAGLEQGTITASGDGATVYYPKAPDVPGLPVAPQEVAPPPPQLTRPVDTRPWNYTDQQIAVYRQICETGRWNDWEAGTEVQSQTCWTLYGRQLGVRPWHPGEPKPWDRPSWPKPWFEPGFHADVPVMWVYPEGWTRPRPQPVISVSIGINVPRNPHARPAPQHRDDLYYPIWAVTPGRPVAARDQARVVAPWSPLYTRTTVTSTTYVSPPVYPGVVLDPMPTDGRAQLVTALPGDRAAWNPNTDARVVTPTAAAIRGATLYGASRAAVAKVLGTDAGLRVATTKARAGSTTTTTTTSTTTSSTTPTSTTTTAPKASKASTTTRATTSSKTTSGKATSGTTKAGSTAASSTTGTSASTTTTTTAPTSAGTTTTTSTRTTAAKSTTTKRTAPSTTTTTTAPPS